ncbi:MFS transporter [Paenibacillus eucommiae]|uniref:FSR family fosmidomycin resistance protein-like MFS transporter n=1 Tax=Paenibacillus eucommiae TaxID=1355755 RepID=A0ABS4IV14_9BACL|nr:MFS transporter [Paenibacillus eucommiae]MBP1991413.1 FSR family fosmidomycin resistance protein-like MFS transporter [Paenibacillus eucommiae]
MNKAQTTTAAAATTVYPILFAISIVHLLNDLMQSTISALFPILKDSLSLSFAQIGLIAFAMNITASFLQPLIGLYADARPKPYILPFGVGFTLIGIIALAFAPNFGWILIAVMCVGIGSAVFHPESSRVAYLAAGGRRGLAQSIFQVGGNFGSALGPIMTAIIFVPLGQFGVIWFVFAAGTAICIQFYVAGWYSKQNLLPRQKAKSKAVQHSGGLTKRQIGFAIAILIMLVFSKNVYISSITSFYSFYLIGDYGVTVQHAQLFLFAFLAASAAGTFLGGPLADRFGRRNIIWISIMGTAPFSILLPYASLFWSGVLCICAGFVLSSAFSIIVVYAQELMPGKIGLVSGLFFGLAFGLGGLGSALLGLLADATSIAFIMKLCAFLPLIGILTVFLPKDEAIRGKAA